MKFGKGAQLVLAIGVFAVGAIFLNRMNVEREAEGERLAKQMETAQTVAPELAAEIEEYEIQLASLEAELETARAAAAEGITLFPASAESIEYDEIIFGMAHDRDLEIVSLAASEPSTMSVSDVDFTVTTFSIKVEGKPLAEGYGSSSAYREFIYGTVSDILDFIDGIAITDNFRSATLKSVDISVPNPLSESEITEMQEAEGDAAVEAPSAIIQVIVYGYEGV